MTWLSFWLDSEVNDSFSFRQLHPCQTEPCLREELPTPDGSTRGKLPNHVPDVFALDFDAAAAGADR